MKHDGPCHFRPRSLRGRGGHHGGHGLVELEAKERVAKAEKPVDKRKLADTTVSMKEVAA